jgi:hypothetical protein
VAVWVLSSTPRHCCCCCWWCSTAHITPHHQAFTCGRCRRPPAQHATAHTCAVPCVRQLLVVCHGAMCGRKLLTGLTSSPTGPARLQSLPAVATGSRVVDTTTCASERAAVDAGDCCAVCCCGRALRR